jgi:hypothetical protein
MANYPAPREPNPAETADFYAPEPGWRGCPCTRRAWPNRYVNQTNVCSHTYRAWLRVDADNQTYQYCQSVRVDRLIDRQATKQATPKCKVCDD